MENKIKELKELAIVYTAALEYDACPDAHKAAHLNEVVFHEPVKGLGILLNKYQGWSLYDIRSEVFRKIKDL